MNAQTSLFDRPAPTNRVGAPYQRSSETSKAAARAAVSKSEQDRETVFEAIRTAGNATRRELETLTGLSTQTLCPRLNELEGLSKKPFPKRIQKATRLVGQAGSQKVVTLKRDGCSVYEVRKAT